MPFYLTPKPDDFNQELQICIAETLYDVDSIVADPGAYTKEELAALHSQINKRHDHWRWPCFDSTCVVETNPGRRSPYDAWDPRNSDKKGPSLAWSTCTHLPSTDRQVPPKRMSWANYHTSPNRGRQTASSHEDCSARRSTIRFSIALARLSALWVSPI